MDSMWVLVIGVLILGFFIAYALIESRSGGSLDNPLDLDGKLGKYVKEDINSNSEDSKSSALDVGSKYLSQTGTFKHDVEELAILESQDVLDVIVYGGFIKFKITSDGCYKIDDNHYIYEGRLWDISIGEVSSYFYVRYEFGSWYNDYKSDLENMCSSNLLSILKHPNGEWKTITPCDDPRKTYWKHFEKLKMQKKQKRDKEIQEYVDSILKKQQEYNDLQLVYECTPSVIIHDVNTFRNFCEMVHEDHKYEDYEIQNILSLKKVN